MTKRGSLLTMEGRRDVIEVGEDVILQWIEKAQKAIEKEDREEELNKIKEEAEEENEKTNEAH